MAMNRERGGAADGAGEVAGGAEPWEDVVCPSCQGPLRLEGQGLTCKVCRRRYPFYQGVPDLVPDRKQAEHEFYAREYARAGASRTDQKIELKALETFWKSPGFPERESILAALGDLTNKRVLVVGGGKSEMLLYLLTLGAELTVTDLAVSGPQSLAVRPRDEKLAGQVRFAGVDANQTPFRDESFDLVLGVGMVHHLSDLDPFFQEVFRVLKKPGRAVFYDNAYSPVWSGLKRTILRPFQVLSHWRWGVSPEDLRATREGGFHEGFLFSLPLRTPFSSSGFTRMHFLRYLWLRGLYTMVGRFSFCQQLARKTSPFFSELDRRLERFRWYRRNTLELIWWLNKS